VRTFRPLNDRSLTDHEDEEVKLSGDQTIRLAHDTFVEAAVRDAWLRQFQDYKLIPLFTQFGKKPLEWTDARRQSREIEDFKGYVLQAFVLRNQAVKAGYQRGPAEDGGGFYTYVKRFPTLGLEAEIQFTGSFLPEEDRPVALTALIFRGRAEEAAMPYGPPLAGEVLGDLPPVLVSECWNDLRLLAEAGTGFDPNWEKLF